ncbi:MAG: histidine kinase [Ruminiclostridium sp.]|nr:histidine kinase [Ruminiclostridium sp.]
MEELIARIGVLEFVQAVIELWNGLFLLIMIFSLMLGRRTDKLGGSRIKIPLTNEILIFFIALFLYNIFGVIVIVTEGTETEIWRNIKIVSIFGYYAAGAFQTLLFLQLIKTHIAEKNNMKKLGYVVTVVQLLQAPCLALLAATPFTGALYYIDEGNCYKRGELFGAWHYTTIASFVFIIAVIALTWKKLDSFLKKIVITAAVIPLIAFIFNFVHSEVSWNNLSVSLLAMIIYMLYEKNRASVTVQAVTELAETRQQLAERELALEQSKNETLMAQIQPHFINNSLMAIRSQCVNYPEVYESITNFSLYLRSNFEALGNTQKIGFDREMESIEAYLALEQQNFGDRLKVEYDIDFDNFSIPPLIVQPLVENAVRHGIATREKGGTVRIKTRCKDGVITVEVTDEGNGNSNITMQQNARRGIGIENVRARVKYMNNGELEIIPNENGTTARLTFTLRGGMNSGDDIG